MTLRDWVAESGERFRHQPPARAAAESVRAFSRGITWHLTDRVVPHEPVWERDDWDVLVVLDACRVDLLRSVADEYDWLPVAEEIGTLWSVASCSPAWIERTFKDHPEARRAGYVTANPFAGRDADFADSALDVGDVGHIDHVYREAWQDVGGVRTVPPEAVTDRMIDAWRRRRELGVSRLVGHWMQPHQPMRSRPDWVRDGHNLDNIVDSDRTAGPCIWQRCRRGEIDREALVEAYRDNLRWALDSVAVLRENCDAMIAITADHGNAIGEWGEWAHPPRSPVPEVRKVPWAVVRGTDERTREGAQPTGDESESVDEQLAALGYRPTRDEDRSPDEAAHASAGKQEVTTR